MDENHEINDDDDWKFYKTLSSGKLQCQVCPRYCVLSEKEIGKCRARVNQGGAIVSRTYGLVSSAVIDPIEKKPLYHYYPKSGIYSIGTVGCNLFCLHCQNASISQTGSLSFLQPLSPKKAVEDAIASGVNSIALTYNEPLINFEYIRDIAKEARPKGLKVVLVSNGYCNDRLAKKLAPLVDAANIDIKGFTKEFYKDICGNALLEPVLNTCKVFQQSGVHLEVTNLIIPTKNDSPEEIGSLVSWISDNLGNEVPLHFSRFYPQWKLDNLPPTPIKTLEMAYAIAQKKGINYVYLGNVHGHKYNSTYCPLCGEVLIHRSGYYVKIENLDLKTRKCKNCGKEISLIS